jgi:hypothetical protein
LWPGWIGAFVNIGWVVSPKTQWFLISLNNLTWLVSTPGGENEWMNFYTQADESYERLGYSLVEERWAYGVEPPSATGLLQLALARDS